MVLTSSVAHRQELKTAGGGDYSPDRIIPDCKSNENNGVVAIRNPKATRPWQHVLEPLSGYLTLAQELFENNVEKGSVWNFGQVLGSDYS